MNMTNVAVRVIYELANVSLTYSHVILNTLQQQRALVGLRPDVVVVRQVCCSNKEDFLKCPAPSWRMACVSSFPEWKSLKTY